MFARAVQPPTARPAQAKAIAREEGLNPARRSRRDLGELLAHDLRRLDDRDAFLDALLDGPRLEPAVGVRPELLSSHIAKALADAFRGHLDRLRLVRVHVDDPDRELLGE